MLDRSSLSIYLVSFFSLKILLFFSLIAILEVIYSVSYFFMPALTFLTRLPEKSPNLTSLSKS
jgi:hypothetical protein